MPDALRIDPPGLRDQPALPLAKAVYSALPIFVHIAYNTYAFDKYNTMRLSRQP